MKKWARELNRAFSKEVQMAKEHMKKCLTSRTIKEMQIKTTLSFRLTSVRMATIKNTNKKCLLLSGAKRALTHCCWGYKLVQPL
jgi:hypothetical protein